MSSIIESAARGVVGSLPGVGASAESASKQNARGSELVRNMAVGGLALGGGVGAAVALLNYLKSLRQEAELEDESRMNDDTLYIPGPREKSASDINRWVAPGVAVTGGVLATGSAYALTQAVYNYLQKKKRQQMLDEAQNEALAAADMETEKSAATMSFSDLVTAFPVAVPLLAALASGGVAYTALNKTFPVVKAPKSKFPKRIRQVASGREDTEETEKVASLADSWAEADCEAAASEFLTLITDSVAMEKGAMCVTSDILNRASQSGLSEMTKVLKDHGMVALCETVKGASHTPADRDTKALAAAAIFKSARLAPVVSTLAAAEMMDMLPGVISTCRNMEPDQLDKMAGLGALMHMSWFRPGMSKAASALGEDHPLLQALMASLKGAPEDVGVATEEEEEDRDAAMTSDINGSMAEDSEGGGGEYDAQGLEDESQGDDDMIDTFMEAPQKAAPPTT